MATVLMATGDFALPSEAGVLKAGECVELKTAKETAETARRLAAEMLDAAARDRERLRREGHEQGVLEGKAEMAERLFEMTALSVEQMAGMENTIVEVVVRSLRTILGSFDDGELVVRVVGHALRLVRDEKHVKLRVATGDRRFVDEKLDEIVRRYPGMTRIDVVDDAALSPGGCVLETEAGMVDATLERQLAIIEDAFRRHLEERRA